MNLKFIETDVSSFVKMLEFECDEIELKSSIEFIREKKSQLNGWISEYGSLILRNFGKYTPEDLSLILNEFDMKETTYLGGMGPRTKLGSRVYTASDVSNRWEIKHHQEMAYQKEFPDWLMFYCKTPPLVRGETYITGIRNITNELQIPLVEKFEKHGLLYTAYYHDQARSVREKFKKVIPIYNPTWQKSFGSNSRTKVNAECKKRGLTTTWMKNGDLKTSSILPAFRDHPITNEKLWFNSATAIHFNKQSQKTDYGDLAYYIYTILYPDKGKLPMNVYFGDGSDIKYSELESIYKLYQENTYKHCWKEGDLIIIDNRLVAHGRNTFRGEREIWASLMASK